MLTTGLGGIMFSDKIVTWTKDLLTFDFGHTIIRAIFAKLLKAFNNASKSLPCL